MTLDLGMPDTVAPFVAAAFVALVTCPLCGLQTDDVATNRRLVCASPAWPCRPCRAAYQRARAETLRCSVARCKSRPQKRKRFCRLHAPRFG